MTKTLYKYFPILVFLSVWLFVISLHKLGLFNVKSASDATYNLIYIGVFATALSYVTAVVYDMRFSTLFSKNRRTIDVDSILLIKITVVLSVICLLGAILTLFVISNNIGGLDVFFNRPLMVRQEVIDISLGRTEVGPLYRVANYLTNIGFLSIIFGGVLFACKSKYRVLGLLPIIVILLNQLVIMGRYRFTVALVFFLGSFLIFTFFQKKKLRVKRLIEISLLSTFSIVFILGLSYLVLKLRSPLADDIIAIVKESGYTYFTGGITALDISLNTGYHSQTFGQYSFRSVFRWLERIGFVTQDQVIPVHNPFVTVSPNYVSNTYTFARSIFLDFGITGLLIISSIWGFFTKFFLFKTYFNFRLIHLLIANIFLFSLIISFFSFYFQSITSILFWIVIMYILDRLYNDRLFRISES